MRSNVAKASLLLLVGLLGFIGFSGCGGESSRRLASIELSPTSISLAAGTTGEITATGIYSDGSKKDLTKKVVWSSSQKTIASVTKGTASALAEGSATITASDESIFAQTTIIVTDANLVSIAVSPSSDSIIAGSSEQFIAIGTFSDDSTQNITNSVTWESSNTSTAVISNDEGTLGLASAVATGSTTITATADTISGTATLNVSSATLVSIDVTPHNRSIASNSTLQFSAIGTFSDFSTQDLTSSVTWDSSDTNIATIDSVGLASSLTAGSTTISGTFGLISGSTNLTVTSATLDSIEIEPTNPSIASGTNLSFVAIGIYSDSSTQDLTSTVTWSSSDTNVATISNASGTEGLASSLTAGPTTITATLGLVSATTELTVTAATLVSIDVSPTLPSIALGTDIQFYAVGMYSDGTTQDLTAEVTWSSSDTNIATVSNVSGSNGFATSLDVGTSTVTATLGLVTSDTLLTVTDAILESIEVTPATPSIAVGSSLQFTAIGTFSDASTQDLTAEVAWASSNTNRATISSASGSDGLATSVSAGTTTISASVGIISGNTVLTVTPATLLSITVTPSNSSIAQGTRQQFTAIGTYSDATAQDLTTQATWTSSALGVATISNASTSRGFATSVAAGTTTITATFGGVSGNTDLTITSAVLVSISITPANPTVAKGATQQFTATGTYSDASTQNLTNAVTWSSSDLTKATISNSSGTRGLATAVNTGSSTITATLGAVSGTTTMTVTFGLDHVTITPSTSTLKKNATRQLTGTAYFSDGSSINVTGSVTRWKTSNAATIKVNHSSTPGLIRAQKSSGSATITFTYSQGGITKSTSIVVTAIP